jgi:hypothetical protein
MPTQLTHPDNPDPGPEGDLLVMSGDARTLAALAADPLLDDRGRNLVVRLYLGFVFAAVQDRPRPAQRPHDNAIENGARP